MLCPQAVLLHPDIIVPEGKVDDIHTLLVCPLDANIYNFSFHKYTCCEQILPDKKIHFIKRLQWFCSKES